MMTMAANITANLNVLANAAHSPPQYPYLDGLHPAHHQLHDDETRDGFT